MVSDSFGHDNEADISKSSEDKTSATGSNVAPRRMGSLFSPMEKTKKAQREVYPVTPRQPDSGDKTILCTSLGSKKCWGVLVFFLTGWEGSARKCDT